ncbi:MAG: histidine kinase [Candidatus Limnocylindria bacterium]
MRSPAVTVQRPLASDRRWRVVLDVALAAVVFAGSAALLNHGGFSPRPESGQLDAAAIGLIALTALPLIAWRRFPLGVFVVGAAGTVLLAGLGYPVDLALGPVVALYLLAATRDQPMPWTGRTTATVAGMLLAYLAAAAVAQGTFPGFQLFHTGLAWAVAWFAGERTRLRREHLADLRKRAQRAEQDAERERLLATAEERARIARDLHDSAGHAISLIAVRAGAARLRHATDPDRSALALQAIEDLARQTVEDIDQIVGTLRGSPAPGVVEAPVGLASLDALIARYTAEGMELTCNVAGATRSIGAAADQAAYRILQEALTNAARHGAGSARVDLTYDDTAVELTVTNPVRADALRRAGGGHGLIGMRERATMVEGSLQAERADGAFRVHARIPTAGHRP